MSNKEIALQQVDIIFKTIQGNFKAVISGTKMIATGIAIAAIPLMEWIFRITLDPIIEQSVTHSAPLLFFLRTVFYWTFFVVLGNYFNPQGNRPEIHPLIKKIWNIGKYFPIIPVATAAVMALSGYSILISPIIMIQIGCLLAVFGLFTSRVVQAIAWCFIVVGISSIYISTLAISNLWIYLVIFQGLALIMMGIILNREQSIQKH